MTRVRVSTIALSCLVASHLAACGEELDSDEELFGEEEIAASEHALSGDAIGVIPEKGVNCPGQTIKMFIWNEDDDNNNQHSGWIGGWTSDGFTHLLFCRVPGASFKPAKSTLTAANYAVLKLGSSCPSGSSTVVRYFDAEDVNQPWVFPAPAIVPSHYGGTDNNNLWLHMCVFKANPAGSTTPFPNLAFSYGVMGGAGVPGAKATGWVYSDDEDDDNNNQLDNHSNTDLSSILAGEVNTQLFTVRVR